VAADDRVALPDGVLEDLAAELPDRPDLDRRLGERPPRAREADRSCERLQRQVLDERGDEHDEEDRVEDRLARPDSGGEGKRREHDRHRAAQPRPRDEQPLAHVEPGSERRDEHGEGPRGEHQHGRERERRPRAGAEPAREDEQAEHDEEHHLGEEREPLVEGDDRAAERHRRVPDEERDDVDREEAARVRAVGGPVGDRRARHRGDRRERRERRQVVRQPRQEPGGD
jgi:hypothetical protein